MRKSEEVVTLLRQHAVLTVQYPYTDDDYCWVNTRMVKGKSKLSGRVWGATVGGLASQDLYIACGDGTGFIKMEEEE